MHALARMPETHYLHPEYEPPEPVSISAAVADMTWRIRHQAIPGNAHLAQAMRECLAVVPDWVIDELLLAALCGRPISGGAREVLGQEAVKILSET